MSQYEKYEAVKIGQPSRTVMKGPNLNRIRPHVVDQAITVWKDLANILVAKFWNDAA